MDPIYWPFKTEQIEIAEPESIQQAIDLSIEKGTSVSFRTGKSNDALKDEISASYNGDRCAVLKPGPTSDFVSIWPIDIYEEGCFG